MESTTGDQKTVQVHLHTVLRKSTPQGLVSDLTLDLPAEAAVGDILRELHLSQSAEHLIVVINHRVADESVVPAHGDRLDIVPAISGG